MKPVYKRAYLEITELEAEDVIATSGNVDPTPLTSVVYEKENAYGTFSGFNKTPGSWF